MVLCCWFCTNVGFVQIQENAFNTQQLLALLLFCEALLGFLSLTIEVMVGLTLSKGFQV